MGHEARPSSGSDRIDQVDALRGFALLGIFTANILVFSGWVLFNDAGRIALAGEAAAEWQHRVHNFFVDGKFYTIFSLLFGAGHGVRSVQSRQRLFPRRSPMDAQPTCRGPRALIEKLRAAGIEVLTRQDWDDVSVGRFARIHDPEGNPIELWEPADG